MARLVNLCWRRWASPVLPPPAFSFGLPRGEELPRGSTQSSLRPRQKKIALSPWFSSLVSFGDGSCHADPPPSALACAVVGPG